MFYCESDHDGYTGWEVNGLAEVWKEMGHNNGFGWAGCELYGCGIFEEFSVGGDVASYGWCCQRDGRRRKDGIGGGDREEVSQSDVLAVTIGVERGQSDWTSASWSDIGPCHELPWPFRREVDIWRRRRLSLAQKLSLCPAQPDVRGCDVRRRSRNMARPARIFVQHQVQSRPRH